MQADKINGARWLAAAAFAMAAGLAAPAQAVLVGYTDSALFQADLLGLPGAPSTLDFDALAVNSLIADGAAAGGITFAYPFLTGVGVTMQVRDVFDTTSGANYLGINLGIGEFLPGNAPLDLFTLAFAASNAIGMFIVSDQEAVLDDVVTLSAGGGSVGLVKAAVQQFLPDGGEAYFLGLIDDAATFATAGIVASGTGYTFHVDDIVVTAAAAAPPPAVPEPGTLSLMVLGLAGLGFAGRRRRA